MAELTSPDLNVNPHEVIQLSFRESENMCANMFNLIDQNGNDCVVMSKRALNNHSKENMSILKKNYKIISSDIKIIEEIGGGSARCMLAELF